MKIINFTTPIKEPCVVTTGNFDGVHLGHRKVLRALNSVAEKKQYKRVVVTFERHPRLFFDPTLQHYVLTPLAEKIELLKNSIDYLIPVHFDHNFANLTPQSYLLHLQETFSMQHYIAGHDHHIGKKNRENFNELISIAKEHRAKLDRIEPFNFQESAVSSTRIKETLETGDICTANKMLGYCYTICGEVIYGRQLGRTIGFPTANIQIPDDKFIPAVGVYIVKVYHNGEQYGGLLNIGTNPTVSDKRKISIEVHILNFDKDIYGEHLTVSLGKKVRDEEKFADLNELKATLENDKAAAIEQLNQTFGLLCS